MCCETKDRNFETSPETDRSSIKELKYCITSASYTNVQAWKKCGGFDTQMIIDWVDWDICIAMRHKGYKILKTPFTYILHELGTNTKLMQIGSHQYLILNRNPYRYYYVARNWIYLARKWDDESLIKNILQNIRKIAIVVIFESNKWNNFKALVKGTIDGFKLKPVYDSTI